MPAQIMKPEAVEAALRAQPMTAMQIASMFLASRATALYVLTKLRHRKAVHIQRYTVAGRNNTPVAVYAVGYEPDAEMPDAAARMAVAAGRSTPAIQGPRLEELRLLCQKGFAVREIAQRLGTSATTIRKAMARLDAKRACEVTDLRLKAMAGGRMRGEEVRENDVLPQKIVLAEGLRADHLDMARERAGVLGVWGGLVSS